MKISLFMVLILIPSVVFSGEFGNELKNIDNFRSGEINKFIKYDGEITYEDINVGYQVHFGFLVPKNNKIFHLINKSPESSIVFSSLKPSDIESINFEEELLKNNWNHNLSGYRTLVDFKKIEGFNTYYKTIENKNKFLVYKEKNVIMDKLKASLSEYNNENKKYISSVFLLTPINSPDILSDSDYDVDKGILEIDMDKNSENFYGYGLYTKGSGNALRTGKLKLYGKFNLKISLDDAIYIFDGNKSVQCYINIYIQPKNNFLSQLWGGNQDFDIKYIVFRFVNDESTILLDVVLHDFKNKVRKISNRYDHEWSKTIFYNKDKSLKLRSH